MTSEEYIRDRLISQRDWRDRKSIEAKKSYNFWRWVSIIASAVAPIIAYWEDPSLARILIILAGSLSLIANAALAIWNPGAHWVRYRETVQRLEREQHLFEAKAGDYAGLEGDGLHKLLVSRVENILEGELDAWSGTVKAADENQGIGS